LLVEQTILELPLLPIPAVSGTSTVDCTLKQELVVTEIGKTKLDSLKVLNTYGELSADQMLRFLRLSPNSLNWLRTQLKELKDKGYVEIAIPAKQTLYGRAPNVYDVGSAGRIFLKNQGVAVDTRFRSLKERLHKGYPLSHSLAVKEVLLNATLLADAEPEVTLQDFETEKQLNANPLRVEIPNENPLNLSPDLWLFFHHRLWDLYTCVEVNLTEVGQTDWRRRIRAYLYSLPAYKARFGTRALIVLTLFQSNLDFPKTTPRKVTPAMQQEQRDARRDRQKRLRNFLKWTEAELTALNAKRFANMFWFTDTRLHETTPQELFFGAHWHIPFHAQPTAPLPPGREADRV
jgi:hypothetical protein